MNKSRKNKSPTPVKQENSAQLTQVTQQQFVGPIPPPNILQDYDQIIPGAAKRILIMAEEEAKHQHELEKSALNFTAEEVKRGQRYGLFIAISAFITSIIALFLGSEEAAMTIGGTTVVGLVTVFVIRAKLSNSPKADK